MSHRVGKPGDNSQINWECGLRACSKKNSEKEQKEKAWRCYQYRDRRCKPDIF